MGKTYDGTSGGYDAGSDFGHLPFVALRELASCRPSADRLLTEKHDT